MNKISIRSPRFFSFLACQFLGALNDNAFKVTIVTLALARLTSESDQVRFSSIAGAMMPIPFLLFSPIAGYLADRWPKNRALFWSKAPEVLAMLLSIWAFSLGSLPFLLLVFFLMCTQSAFFSPPKYGILPEIFHEKDLSIANGILEMTTNVAILLGSVLGVIVFGAFQSNLILAGVVYSGIAGLGLAFAYFIPKAPPGNKAARLQAQPIKSFLEDRKWMAPHQTLNLTLLGIAYFYFLGALFLTLVPVFGKSVLQMQPEKAGLLLAFLSIGIAIGSGLAGRWSRGRVEIGLVPLGSVGLTVFALVLSLCRPESGFSLWGLPLKAALSIFGLGIAGGLYIVPLKSYLQQQSPAGMKGRTVSYSNMQTFGAVLLASFFAWLMTGVFHLSVSTVLMISSGLTFLAAIVILKILPDFFVRAVLLILTRFVYRIEVHGSERLPGREAPEGALLVSNHVSWMDAILIATVCDRPVRFLMYRGFFEIPGLKHFFHAMGVIPISSKDTEEQRESSFESAREKIRSGDWVCIFAEGAITRVGGLLKFRKGLEKIADRDLEAPVVPVYLDGLWGSIFSFEKGKFFWKWPKAFPYRVRIFFGEPLSPGVKAYQVREAVELLSFEAMRSRPEHQHSLTEAWRLSARRNWLRPFWNESEKTWTYGDVFAASLRLRRELFPVMANGNERVAIVGLRSVETALAHLVVRTAGREVSHYCSWKDVTSEKIRSRGVMLILDSGTEKEEDREWGIPIHPVRDLIQKALKTKNRYWEWLRAWKRFPSRSEDLRLWSVMSGVRELLNVERSDQAWSTYELDSEIGVLANLWMPIISGASVRFGESGSATLWILDPEKKTPLSSGSPRAVFLPQFPEMESKQLSDQIQKTLRIDPMTGWGNEEIGAVAFLNIPDHGTQIGKRESSAGRPLPGVATQVRSPDDGRALPPGEKGLLWIRSGAAGPEWFNTGEVATKDEDGFVRVYS